MTCQENALGSLPHPPPRIIGLPGIRPKLLEMHASWEHRQQTAGISFNPFQGFGPIPWKPDAQGCHAGCCSQALRWEHSRESCFTIVAFSYVEFEQIQGSRQCRLECVCCSPAEGKREWRKKLQRFSVFCPNSGDSMAADCSCLWPYKARSRSVGNWRFFLCLNPWLVYLRNTGEWPGQAKHTVSE